MIMELWKCDSIVSDNTVMRSSFKGKLSSINTTYIQTMDTNNLMTSCGSQVLSLVEIVHTYN